MSATQVMQAGHTGRLGEWGGSDSHSVSIETVKGVRRDRINLLPVRILRFRQQIPLRLQLQSGIRRCFSTSRGGSARPE